MNIYTVGLSLSAVRCACDFLYMCISVCLIWVKAKRKLTGLIENAKHCFSFVKQPDSQTKQNIFTDAISI